MFLKLAVIVLAIAKPNVDWPGLGYVFEIGNDYEHGDPRHLFLCQIEFSPINFRQ